VSGEDWIEWIRVFEPDQRDEKNDRQQLQYLSATKAFIKLLQDLARQWQSKYQTSQDWTELLKNHLIQLGMMDALQIDPAGKNVLEELQKLGQLQQSRMNVSGWVSLFDTWMEQSSFTQDVEYQSVRISIIPLSSTRLNQFDAVVMVGCDNRQLPSPVDHGSIFSRAMLTALDEQLPVYEYLSQARDLSQLLVTHNYVDFLWQEFQKAEEVNRPAAWLTRLQMGLPSFKDASIELSIGQTQSVSMLPSTTKVIYSGLLPTQISPSSYQTLRTCPYRFFVSYILQLRSPKALQHLSEFGSIGTLLHDILKEFYRSYDKHQISPSQTAQRKWMEQELRAISKEQWKKLIQLNGQLLYEQEQWLEQIPDWVDWQLNQEGNGWKFDEAEKNLEFALQLSNGVSVLVKGRADRIDRKENNEFRVWDYKFKSLDKLKKSQKHLEDDPQLLMYSNALLVKGDSEISVKDTGWIGLRDPKGKDRAVMQELSPEILEDLQDQMTSVLSQVWQGRSLPANGPTQICQYCEARGLCRKGMF
jgi:ATP-dependent helicase/nuclease subunit B